MKNLIIALLIIPCISLSQKDVRTFIFGHSLINHEYQVNQTPSQETSVPHWFQSMANIAGNTYAVSGQYGFLQQHVNLPPFAQWGFDSVAGAWDSDNETFSQANFTNILLTPSNFEQWQAPTEDYYNDTITPIEATNTIFRWCSQQEDSMTFYIYENWPDMGPYLSNGFPPSPQEWSNYNAYLNGGFHDWFMEYFDSVRLNNPDLCVRMIPVGPVISGLLSTAPFNQIPIDQLYEDDAPHGRPTIYFLAAMTTYMAMYEEMPPSNYFPDTTYISPVVANNFQIASNYIWNELQNFNDINNQSYVYCSTALTTNVNEHLHDNLNFYPNPVTTKLYTNKTIATPIVYNIYGQKVNVPFFNKTFDVSNLKNGVYIIQYESNNGWNSIKFIKE